MTRDKIPVRLSRLTRSYATHKTMHPVPGDLPGAFIMDFGRADGPGNLNDGRDLRSALKPAELAAVLSAIPALSLDTGSLMAVARVTDLLAGKTSRFTGVRLDDLDAVLTLLAVTLPQDAPLSDRERTALKRLRQNNGLAGNEATPEGGEQETPS